jgi:cell division protein FtsQ
MKLKLWVKIFLGSLAVLTAVAFVSIFHNSDKAFSNVVVKIDEATAPNLINENRVRKIIDSQGVQQTAEGKLLNADLAEIEKKIEEEAGFVSDCQVSRDLKGNLVVNIIPSQPIARMLKNDSKGNYIGKEGEFLPLSPDYTPRVVLLTGKGMEHIYDKDNKLTKNFGKSLFNFLKYIENEPFWKAQITEIDIDEYDNLTIYPQIGNHAIEFGLIEDYMAKLAKLKLFYDQIVPAKGWNKYKKIKLGFDNQIVCE